MQITYPPEMLPTSDGDEAIVIACNGTECCLREENERLRAAHEPLLDALGEAAGKNDLSGVADDLVQSAACNALYEVELIARNAIRAYEQSGREDSDGRT